MAVQSKSSKKVISNYPSNFRIHSKTACADAIFPVLPRWFTEPLHARTRWPSISMQDGSKFFSNPQVSSHPDVEHEYELLEILFEKVFDRRFINMKPSCACLFLKQFDLRMYTY